jgi:hypothetical protein
VLCFLPSFLFIYSGLYDYPQVVKRSMDLGSVKKKIADRKYKSLYQAADDVRLVWTNCMTYNADGSDFFILAKNLSKKWEDKYSKVLKDLQLDESSEAAGGASPGGTAGPSGHIDASNKMSVDDKKSFARSLYKISKEELGKLIVEVDTKCPSALTKNSAEDECELNVDKLSPQLFQELKLFVADCGKTQPLKKKTSTGGSSSGKRQKT